MQRLVFSELAQWLSSAERKPLIIRGARQVGKSTAVRHLAQAADRELIEINLERHLQLNKVFETLDLNQILPVLEAITQKKIVASTSLLFLDEIQATPAALQALRYFYEEMPELPLVAAGSLLELTLGIQAITMPVGRIQYLHLGPLTFDEFLSAKGETYFIEAMAKYEFESDWPDALHQHGLILLKEYILVGGMPAALSSYLTQPQATNAWILQLQSIVDTYKDDFAKYTHRAALLPILQQIYDRAPRQLSQPMTLNDLAPGVRHEYVKEAVRLLTDARVLQLSRQSDATGVPLNAGVRDKSPKVFWLDIGLINRMQRVEPTWLNQNFSLENAGALAEQFVAQHLAYWHGPYVKPELYYWARGGKTSVAEVDFVVQAGGAIVPIEVKSGASGSLRSLHQFLARDVGKSSSAQFGVRLDTSKPTLQPLEHQVRMPSNKTKHLKSQLLSLPLYMIGELKRLATAMAHTPRETSFS